MMCYCYERCKEEKTNKKYRMKGKKKEKNDRREKNRK
jgi:hypothetical protein